MIQSAVQPAFRNPAHDAQAVFRAVMDALARPGTIQRVRAEFASPSPLSACAAAIVLTLADYETPIWLDAPLMRNAGVAEFIRFHTGAKLVSAPEEAVFAVIADAANTPPLTAFAQGLPDYPDRSTTVIFQVERLFDEGLRLAGPGIHDETAFGAAPLPRDIVAQLAENGARFPLGVDILFAAPGAVAGLPRSTRILEAR